MPTCSKMAPGAHPEALLWASRATLEALGTWPGGQIRPVLLRLCIVFVFSAFLPQEPKTVPGCPKETPKSNKQDLNEASKRPPRGLQEASPRAHDPGTVARWAKGLKDIIIMIVVVIMLIIIAIVIIITKTQLPPASSSS